MGYERRVIQGETEEGDLIIRSVLINLETFEPSTGPDEVRQAFKDNKAEGIFLKYNTSQKAFLDEQGLPNYAVIQRYEDNGFVVLKDADDVVYKKPEAKEYKITVVGMKLIYLVD